MDAEQRETDALARWRDSASAAAGRAYEAAHGREIADESRGMRWAVSPRVAMTVACGLALAVLLAWALLRPTAESLGPVPAVAVSPTVSASVGAVAEQAPSDDGGAHAAASATEAPIVVYVSGAVARPGLVELAAGDRIADAVEAVGGALPDADLSAVNLARVPADGEQIAVPVEGEAPAAPASGAGAPSLVALNSADAAALEELPGIGPVLAERIVADRDANGPFATVEDLARVSGVGDALVENLDGLVTM
ncbi:ComEA family DNA-binding protein [Demequina sp. NBRC 110057]|uniref:ComEA family DNA-binding protein n=1 Tax=Demequina sp. NBRC 110057 TaxID=1570346 RepID=UPI001F3A7162|nr:ComEA family DNA-binding protein [Demequina sp. NBRC 110057]